MQEKLQTRAFEQVAGMLHPGEQPLAAARAMVGKYNSSRFGAVVKQAVLVEAGGALGAAIASGSGKQFFVLTTHRMIFLSQTFMGGPGKRVIGEVPRTAIALAEVKMGAVSLVRLAFGPNGDGVALTFPRVDKKNAQQLADALQQQSPVG
ncbi:hypothetical protein [Actinoplanes sp. NPDC051411]|uniref:hypothetical protein n=1 Tax=Actinoplanes sp. NPDC051411 TaxID=3155522 RepID=UPI003430952F